MNIFGKLKSLLLYSGIDKKSYKTIQSKLNSDNYKNLISIVIISIVYFLISFVLGFFVDELNNKQNTYAIGIIELVLILIIHISLSKKSNKIQSLLIILLEISLLSSGIFVSLSDAHNRLSVMLMVLYTVTPMLFADMPIKIISIIIVTDIVYLIPAYNIKAHDIFSIDFINVLTYSSLGLIIGTRLTHIRYERYIYEASVKQLAEDRYKISNTDEPTGLLNRRAFQIKTEELKLQNFEHLYLIMFDLNGLKYINDHYGHIAGNRIISGAAECISAVFKNDSSVFRYGGDEFIVLSTESKDIINTQLVVLWNEIKNWNKQSKYVLSLSYGISEWNHNGELNFETLLAKADAAMYINKQEYYEKSGFKRRQI